MGIEAASGHELVDKRQSFPATVPADELDDVAVPKLAHDIDLCLKLLPPLHGRLLLRERLDGHMPVLVTQVASVHRTEPPSPDLFLLGEIVRRGGKLAVAKLPRSQS